MQLYLFDIPTEISTERTHLRRLREGDGPAIHRLVQSNRHQLSNYFPTTVPATSDPQRAEEFVLERLAHWLLQEEYTLVVQPLGQERVCGMVRVFRIDWRVPAAEVGYFLDEAQSGQGWMTEILQAVADYAAEHLRMKRLTLRISPDNLASQRVAIKCGFEQEGILRSSFRQGDGRLIDALVFGRVFD